MDEVTEIHGLLNAIMGQGATKETADGFYDHTFSSYKAPAAAAEVEAFEAQMKELCIRIAPIVNRMLKNILRSFDTLRYRPQRRSDPIRADYVKAALKHLPNTLWMLK